jgi:2-phosphosulfolactate phosphatase
MDTAHRQGSSAVRFDWGLAGARAVADGAAARFALEHGAVLAAGRSAATGSVTLSPPSLGHAARHDAGTRAVAVVAAGERWPDGSLRPAVEDLYGAGAVIEALRVLGWTDLSPEARAAAAAYTAVRPDLGQALAASASGRELVAAGFGEDVAIAPRPTAAPWCRDWTAAAFRRG